MHRVNGDVGLGNDVYKVTQETTLIRNSKCLVTVQEGTLAAPLYVRDKPAGYVFHGAGQFSLDAIIETRRGALGKPIAKELGDPFIMLARGDFSSSMSPATAEYLAKMGYENAEVFIERALKTCKGFLDHNRHVNLDFWSNNKKIFALPQNDKFEILVSSDDSTTYVAKDGVYVFKGNEQVLTGSKEIVVAKHGRFVAIKDGQILIEKRGKDET